MAGTPLVWARKQQARTWGWLGATGVGAMVALAWMRTLHVGYAAFDALIPVQAISFAGPSADVLLWVLSPPGQPWKIDLGLMPGVFLGFFLAAASSRELKPEGFQGGQSMRRYIVGAVGAGVSSAAVFTLANRVT